MTQFVEIERDRYGGHYDDRAINAHSERTYRDQSGYLFRLARNLDVEGRPFEAYGPFSESYIGILPRLQVDGQDTFCTGRSWNSAEKSMKAAIDLLRTKDLVRTPMPGDEPGNWVILQHGLSGITAEIWEVEQEHIDRHRWGSWITNPGWYWQCMDIAEVHGPFDTMDAAFSDYQVNRNEPGIKPRSMHDTPGNESPKACRP